jgi:large subunit ribosomal protein L18
MKNISRNKLRIHRKARIKAKIKGTSERPRLAVFRSLMNISVQVIDDEAGKTLVSAGTKEIKSKKSDERISGLGKLVSKKCSEKKINTVVFDRSGYKYHGRVKLLAESLREAGLKF